MYDEKFIEKEHAELRLLYQSSLNDIENAKRREWAIIYYVLLSFAGIIGFYHFTEVTFHYTCLVQKLPLMLTSLFLSYLGIYLLMDTHKCQCQYRKRLQKIKLEFETVPQRILDISIYSNSYSIRWHISVFCVSIIGLFFVITFWPNLLKNWSHPALIFIVLLIVFGVVAILLITSPRRFPNKVWSPKTDIKNSKYTNFSYYFWTLIFPFMILIMAGLFYVVWLLFNDTFSMIEIIIFVFSAETVCFVPCYCYYKTAVKKTNEKPQSVDYLSLKTALEKSIGILEKEEGPLKKRRQEQVKGLRKILKACEKIYKNI